VIIRAGGLTLRAPDRMPEEARGDVESLTALIGESAVVCGGTDMSAAWSYMAAVEVAAFGRRHADRLRRCGPAARHTACRQLLTGWGAATPDQGGA
jgi:hypothetical protein